MVSVVAPGSGDPGPSRAGTAAHRADCADSRPSVAPRAGRPGRAALWPIALSGLVLGALCLWAESTQPSPPRRGMTTTAEDGYGPNTDMVSRLKAKCSIADEVLAGRLTLAQAAARFQELNRSARVKTDWEGCCRQVINAVRASADAQANDPACGRDPCWGAFVAARLEAELEDQLSGRSVAHSKAQGVR